MEDLHINIKQSKFIQITNDKYCLAIGNNILHIQHKDWILSIHYTDKQTYRSFLSYNYNLIFLTIPYTVYNMKQQKPNNSLILNITENSILYDNKIILSYNNQNILFGLYYILCKKDGIYCTFNDYCIIVKNNKYSIEHSTNITQCCTFYVNNIINGINCSVSKSLQKQWYVYITNKVELVIYHKQQTVIFKYDILDNYWYIKKISIFDSNYELLQIHNKNSEIVTNLNNNFLIMNDCSIYIKKLFNDKYRKIILQLI